MLNLQQIQQIYTPDHGMEVKGRGTKQSKDPVATRNKVIKLRDLGYKYKEIGLKLNLSSARCAAIYIKYKKEQK